MKKIQLTPKKSLGRVLSLDEMRTISGGMNAYIHCQCTLFIEEMDKNGLIKKITKEAEPTGDFYTESLCQFACDVTCNYTAGCSYAAARFFTGSGSGSYSI